MTRVRDMIRVRVRVRVTACVKNGTRGIIPT